MGRQETRLHGRSVAILPSLKLAHCELEFVFRIAGEDGNSVEIVLDLQRGISLPAMLLIFKQYGNDFRRLGVGVVA